MTLAKPVYHGYVYEVTLHDFRDVYRADKDLNSEFCIHKMTSRAVELFGFETSSSGKFKYARNVQFPTQKELYDSKVIQFDEIQRTNVSIEFESLTTDRYMNEDWMVFSFATVILEDDLTAFLDIRSPSKFDLRKFRFVSKHVVVPYVDNVKTHYEPLHADINAEFPTGLESYIPPDEPA